jgi:hypothetical protein
MLLVLNRNLCDANNLKNNTMTKLEQKQKDERFKMPTDKELIEIALLFNDGKIQKRKLSDMIGMCQFVLDRLYENNDVMKPSNKENHG